MQRILAFGLAVAMAVVLGRVTLVRADCAYHKAQAAVGSAKTSKEVATVPAVDKTVASQLQTAQTDKPATPAPQTKK